MKRQFLLDDLSCNFNIVLINPDIPPNTGNIARLCVATGSTLHLVKPLGFSLSDRKLKRAGLDYWPFLNLKVYENIDDFFGKNPTNRMFFASTKASQSYFEVSFKDGDYIVFGSETKGLDEQLIEENFKSAINIPMKSTVRSLNLADSVAIVLYEAIRQVCFKR